MQNRVQAAVAHSPAPPLLYLPPSPSLLHNHFAFMAHIPCCAIHSHKSDTACFFCRRAGGFLICFATTASEKQYFVWK